MTKANQKSRSSTGAGSGVGRASALALLRDGWAVGLAAGAPKRLKRPASVLERAQPWR